MTNMKLALYLFKKVLTSKPGCWGITINCELQAISFHYFSFSFGKLAPKLVKLGALVEIVNLITSKFEMPRKEQRTPVSIVRCVESWVKDGESTT